MQKLIPAFLSYSSSMSTDLESLICVSNFSRFPHFSSSMCSCFEPYLLSSLSVYVPPKIKPPQRLKSFPKHRLKRVLQDLNSVKRNIFVEVNISDIIMMDQSSFSSAI